MAVCVLYGDVDDDDEDITTLLTQYLARFGFTAHAAGDGPALRAQMAAHPIDLIVLDIMLPGADGLTLARELRQHTQVPIIMLTARANPYDCVLGLEMGADDYMAKPFELPELEARVRALTRRSTGTSPVIEYGALAFDQTDRCALLNGEMLDLSARELGLLEILMSRAGRLVSKDQLVDHLCGWGEEVSHNAIEVYVHRLRKKLEASGVSITTVRGLGYCFEKSAQEAKS